MGKKKIEGMLTSEQIAHLEKEYGGNLDLLIERELPGRPRSVFDSIPALMIPLLFCCLALGFGFYERGKANTLAKVCAEHEETARKALADKAQNLLELKQELASQFNPDERHALTGRTLFHVAAKRGQFEIMRRLHDLGANPNIQAYGWTNTENGRTFQRDVKGVTPLMVCIYNKHYDVALEMIKILEVDVTVVDESGGDARTAMSIVQYHIVNHEPGGGRGPLLKKLIALIKERAEM